MLKFYSLLWFFWLLRMLLVSLVFSSVVAGGITLFVYMQQGFVPLSGEVLGALYEIFYFWFLLLLNIAIPLALFINAKYLFNHCIDGVSLKLLSCPKEGEQEVIETIGYGDLIKVWRKWLLLIVWGSAALMLFSVLFSYMFTSYSSLFEWFNVYILYLFISFSGFFAIVLLASRCKQVRLSSC